LKRPELTNRKLNYVAVAFLIPFLGFLAVMLAGKCAPFGKFSMLYSDMYHQYFPFFKAFRNALRMGDSLLYNWNVGMGLDFTGLYAYYLASPLNLLSVLVPESWLLGYFSLLVPIKLGLASMFFSIFLKKVFNKNDLSIALFGSFYGMCAWALGYQWNVMWLDTFALLPLVAFGTISLLRDRKFVLYTVTLFLSVFANYYIGFFTCIFVLLLFICYEICRFKGFRGFIEDLGRIALFSALAIGMTAILTIPAYVALQNTHSSINKFPHGLQLNMTTNDTWTGLFEVMRNVAGNMNGGIAPSLKEGLPNIYCGVFANILAVLYLFCRKIRLRDKLCAVCLLLFLNVSFIFRQLDYIWHGFHFTNMIPYRFSFLYSFVLLYMAYAAWTHRRQFRLWQIIIALVASVGLMLCAKNPKDTVFLAYNGVLILLYISTLLYSVVFPRAPENADALELLDFQQTILTRKHLCSIVLLGIIATELVLNLVNFGVSFPLTNASDYPRGLENTEAVIEYMKEREKDTPFYRAEVTHTQTLNDGALNNYYGITTFTSSANVKVTEFMAAMGYGAKNSFNRYSFEESSPVSNLFLGLKYMLERKGKVEENPYFDVIYNKGPVTLLENNAYLPLGFLANFQLLNVDFKHIDNRFTIQNYLLSQASGLKQDVWNLVPKNVLTISSDTSTFSSYKSTGYCSYATDSKAGTISYSYTANRNGLLCAFIEQSKKNSFSFWLNGEQLYSETYSVPQMLSVSNVKPGDIVEVKVNCKAGEKGTARIDAAILDEEAFRQHYDVLAASTLNLTAFSNTNIEGTINCDRDGVLYTSIPQNGNWTAYVDGEPTETLTVCNAMVGVMLTEGEHTIRFVYRNDAFSLGWKVSLISLLAFLGTYFYVYRPSFRFPGKKNKH